MKTDETNKDDSLKNSPIIDGIEEFREEIGKQRVKIWGGDKSYEDEVVSDEDYRILLDKSDLTEGDKELYLKRYRAKAELAKKRDEERYKAEKEKSEQESEDEASILGEDEGISSEEENEKAENVQEEDNFVSFEYRETMSNEERYKWKSNSVQFKKEKTLQEQIQAMIEDQKKDFENYLGGNFAGKLGAAMMIIGFIIGINYGISIGLIGQMGIILIGFAVGSALLYVGHRAHEKNPAVTTTLVTIGIWVMYFSVYKLYTYLDLEHEMLYLAYFINFCVTALSIAMAINYKREPLAFVSVLAGYITPLFVGNQVVIEDFYGVLFTYLLMMNIALMVVANKMQWRSVNIGTFVASFVILFVWVMFLMNPTTDLTEALVFTSLYFFAFYVMNIVYTLQVENPLAQFNRILLFANTAIYIVFILKINIHAQTGVGTMGFFYLFQSALSCVYAYILYREDKIEEHEGLFGQLLLFSLLFLNWSLFLIFDLASLNVLWSIEAALVLYIGLRTRIEVLNKASLIITAFSLVTMVICWVKNYSNPFLNFMANDAVLHTLISMLSIVAMVMVINHEKRKINQLFDELVLEEGADVRALEKERKEEINDFEDMNVFNFSLYSYVDFLITLMILVVFVNGNIEFAVNTPSNFGGNDIRKIIWGIFNTAFVMTLWYTAKHFKMENFKSNATFLLVVSIVSYFFMGSGSAANLRMQFLLTDTSFFPFFLHYLDVGLGIFGLLWVLKDIATEKGMDNSTFSWLTYFSCLILTIHASIELDHLFVLFAFNEGDKVEEILSTSHLVGYSLLWTFFAFGILYYGMIHKIKELRFFSITLFSFVLLKFFFFDFWQISKGNKILAFIVIGAILVAVSALYKKLQQMVLEGEISALTGGKKIETVENSEEDN